MKALTAIINSLLAAFIIMSGTIFVANKVADAQYLNTTAEKSGVYKGVSEVASRRLAETSARNLGIPVEQIPAEASSVVSEEYVASKSQEITSQVESVLRGEKKSVVIDISDLSAKAQAAGLSVNPSDLKPIEITPPQQENEQNNIRIAQNLNVLRFISYFVTALLFIASVALSVVRRSLLGLAGALLSSGVVFAAFALMAALVSSAASEWITLPEEVVEVTPYVHAFIHSVVNNVSNTYIWLAVVSSIIGLLLIPIDRMIKRRRSADTQQHTVSSVATNAAAHKAGIIAQVRL